MSERGASHGVRDLRTDDIPALARLYERVMTSGLECERSVLEDYLTRLFFTNPWHDDGDMVSGVLEGSDGDVVGFLGVVPRRMIYRGRRVRVAVPCHLMVDKSATSPLGALRLVQRLLAGPHDLAIAEANEMSQKIWEGLGGRTSWLYGLAWAVPLRPVRSGLRSLSARGRWAVSPVATGLDWLAARYAKSPFHRRKPDLIEESLTPKALCECVAELTSGHSLRPDYDESSARWLLEFLQAPPRSVRLRGQVLRDGEGRRVGWCLYDARPGEVSQLIQLGGREDHIEDVISHVLYDAWRAGSVALAGRFDSRFTRRFWSRPCLFSQAARLTLVHARDPEILDALHRGDAFLSRLEGEWWVA